MPAEFVVKKGTTGTFRFALLGTNGRVIASSEVYNHKAACICSPPRAVLGFGAGQAHELQAKRTQVLTAAYQAHPERFCRTPTPPKLPTVAWINQPPQVIVTR